MTEGKLKSLIKEGLKEAQQELKDENKENEEQQVFIENAKPKYYEVYTDLSKIVQEVQGKFSIDVDNRKLNNEEQNIVMLSKKKFEQMLKDELVERRIKTKKLKEKEDRRLKNFKKEMKIEQIK